MSKDIIARALLEGLRVIWGSRRRVYIYKIRRCSKNPQRWAADSCVRSVLGLGTGVPEPQWRDGCLLVHRTALIKAAITVIVILLGALLTLRSARAASLLLSSHSLYPYILSRLYSQRSFPYILLHAEPIAQPLQSVSHPRRFSLTASKEDSDIETAKRFPSACSSNV